MRDLRTYILEGFKLGKNKVKKEEDDFVDLGLPSGTLWCRYNVGATRESTPESWYGDYFMWGDPEPANSKICDWNNYKHCNGNYDKFTKYCPLNKINHWDGKGKPDNKSVLDKEDDMARATMGKDWKMPTKEQLHELLDNTTNKWVKDYNDIQGLNGRLFTSKTNGNILFIPAAGHRYKDYFENVGSYIRVWSSKLFSTDPKYVFYLYSDDHDIDVYGVERCHGYSVRAVIN